MSSQTASRRLPEGQRTEKSVVAGRITVGITCFNAADTILAAVSSALEQDWPDVEVVVVDDCSTDGSQEIVERCVIDHSRVRLVRHIRNLGPGAARQSIVAAATGEFVAFFDDDDVSLTSRIRQQAQRIVDYERTHGVDLIACYASGTRRYPNGYELRLPAIGSEELVPCGEAVADYLLFNERKPGVFFGAGTPTCALMTRSSTLERVGGFDPAFRRVEDIDFAVRLALAGGHFIGCRESLFVQHATVSADKAPDVNLRAELQLLEKHADYLRSRRRYRYATQWFRLRHLHFSGQRARFAGALLLFLLQFPLAGTRHVLRSGPARSRHEKQMARSSVQNGEVS